VLPALGSGGGLCLLPALLLLLLAAAAAEDFVCNADARMAFADKAGSSAVVGGVVRISTTSL
jgi:hypothetical protein